MTALGFLTSTAAGERSALILLAVMSVVAWRRSSPESDRSDRYKRNAWGLMALAIATFSPAHTAWLIGHPAPHLISRTLDVVGTGLACMSFVLLLAAWGLKRGISETRVHRGMLANTAVIVSIVGLAWIIT